MGREGKGWGGMGRGGEGWGGVGREGEGGRRTVISSKDAAHSIQWSPSLPVGPNYREVSLSYGGKWT